MVTVGLGVFFAGYTLLVYGLSQVGGCNAGLLDLVWPGRFGGCNADAGSSGGAPFTSGTVLKGGGCPPGYTAVITPGKTDIKCVKNTPGGPLAPGPHPGGGYGA